MVIIKNHPLAYLFNTMVHRKMITPQLKTITDQTGDDMSELSEMWRDIEVRKPNNSGFYRKRFKGYLFGYNSEHHEYVFVNMWDTLERKPVLKYTLIGASDRCDHIIPREHEFIGTIMQYGNSICPVKVLLFKSEEGAYYAKELHVSKDKTSIVNVKLAYSKTNNPLDKLEGRWVVKDTSNPHVRLIACKSWKIIYISKKSKGGYYVSNKCLVSLKKSS